MNLIKHMTRQINFSLETFGPHARQKGVTDHIRKELVEIVDGNNDPGEWVDVVLLGLDGLWRSIKEKNPGWTVAKVAARATILIAKKQAKNERRSWPDWRTTNPDQAIEHVKGIED